MTKILVIEDEESLREEIVEILGFEEFDVAEAPNGRVGLEVARQIMPDIIICDISMPEMDGYEVLQELREDEKTSRIPFIFLTARADRSFMRHGMELGADDYLTKPFSNNELLAAIKARLSRHTTITELHPQELERARKNLVQMVAHELRTPLTAINMVQEVISRQFGQLSHTGLEELLDIQRSGSDRLAHLIDQMVLLTQLEAGSLSSDAIIEKDYATQTWALLSKAVNLGRKFAARQPKASVRLDERDKGAEVICDPHALTHAFAEIISNALNFSPDGGEVAISQWRSGGFVLVSIVDQGQGMSEKQLEQALEMFQQIDREVREQQGMGIGLPLARRIIDVHGGALEMKSVAGRGTQVTIKLPQSNESSD
jgi:two-component system sensor histidine kinase/response regulator